MTDTPILVADNVTKRYGQTLALDAVTVALNPGEVLGLVGHNGAGKSTLLRLLAGAERPDSGQITIGGQRRVFAGPADAIAAGVACVYQELSLVDQLTVAQNMFLGRERLRGGHLAKTEMENAARQLCAAYGLDVDPSTRLRTLSVAQRQMVEIVSALHRDARYLLLDEPTTALEAKQIDRLLATIKRLAHEKGLAVMLVDHKLDEVFAVADRVTALNTGRVVLTGPANQVSRRDVVHAIIGESTSVDDTAGGSRPTELGRSAAGVSGAAKPILIVEHLATDRLVDVSLTAYAGRVLGLYGLVGSGRSRFLRTLVGLERPTAGTMTLDGQPYRPLSPHDAILARVAYLSEERKADGFVPAMTPAANVSLPVLDRFARLGLLRRRAAAMAALQALRRLEVRGYLGGPMTALSGGNQQKALFARVFLQDPRLLLLDQPTKGVDIGAKAEIHGIIRNLVASTGMAVIVVSDEEQEVLGLSDEVAIFRLGRCDGTTHPHGALDGRQIRQLAWTGDDESRHTA